MCNDCHLSCFGTIGAPESEGVAVGMQIGLQMLNNLQRMEELGIKPDRNAIVNSFKKAFLADSTDMDAARGAQMAYQEMMGRIQRENKEFEDAKKANAPEAVANTEAGEKYLAEARAKDPSIKVSESGLAYKIENAGDTAKITRRDIAQIKYTGRLVDGTVFAAVWVGDAVMPYGVFVICGRGLRREPRCRK